MNIESTFAEIGTVTEVTEMTWAKVVAKRLGLKYERDYKLTMIEGVVDWRV